MADIQLMCPYCEKETWMSEHNMEPIDKQSCNVPCQICEKKFKVTYREEIRIEVRKIEERGY